MEEIEQIDWILDATICYFFRNKISCFGFIFSKQINICRKVSKNSQIFPILLVQIGTKWANNCIFFRNQHFRISHLILERVNTCSVNESKMYNVAKYRRAYFKTLRNDRRACSIRTAHKISRLTPNICSGQIWCKEVQTRRKPGGKMVNKAIAS